MAEKDNSSCSEFSRQDISAYLECELEPKDELRLETHLANCSVCKDYLNSIKLVATSLEILLDNDPLEIPEKFTGTVKAAAQSSVDAVRSPKEKSRGLLVAAMLFCFTAFAVGIDVAGVRPAFADFADKLFALSGFVGHFFYTLSVGFSVIVGGVCAKLFFGSAVPVAGLLAVLLGSAYIFSKHMTRLNRS